MVLGNNKIRSPHHELKEKETSVEVCRLADQLKEQEEKINDVDGFYELHREEEEIKEQGQNSSQPQKTTDLNNSMEELSGLEIEEKALRKIHFFDGWSQLSMLKLRNTKQR